VDGISRATPRQLRMSLGRIGIACSRAGAAAGDDLHGGHRRPPGDARGGPRGGRVV